MDNRTNTVSKQEYSVHDEVEFLSFVLGEEHYALDIMSVKEIRGYEPVTKIANAPGFIKGVLNLRGDIVPIVDLRMKFAVGSATYNEFTIVIMLNVFDRIVGIVVDAVSDVIKLAAEEILPAPEFGVAFDSRYLKGLATVEDKMIILVNIQALISSDELGLIDANSLSDQE
ncbi:MULTISPECIES: chemotaxis protein CheW [unclassified Shewanella]|uniref:chemotaxis protein CheW n=1 Tax=unclassified Shewanella TaxID=196818 RepID=UPI000B34325E|nr:MULTISPECIES: chemotaxis protein CheW [unclassified Shewanella]MDH1470538.1 chemotaxis protein CheW [Shewanella sp. GD03713]QXN23299.1 chemotaxis protein CheW [Shewanella putrefaciens]VEE64471.1 Chemotaxis protein CheW [Shewanella putrefaciens]